MSAADMCGSAGPGPYPAGDPEAIRAVAAELRRVAAMLGSASAPSLAAWRARAATRTRASLGLAVDEADRAAGELRSCAASLDTAANALETDQRAWRLARWRVNRERP